RLPRRPGRDRARLARPVVPHRRPRLPRRRRLPALPGPDEGHDPPPWRERLLVGGRAGARRAPRRRAGGGVRGAVGAVGGGGGGGRRRGAGRARRPGGAGRALPRRPHGIRGAPLRPRGRRAAAHPEPARGEVQAARRAPDPGHVGPGRPPVTRFARSEPAPGVVQLAMCRPEKSNAMDRAFFAELTELMSGFGGDDRVRAVVLTGAGRAFSAGGDIDMFADLDGDVARVRPHLRAVYDAFHAVERCAVPVIAAVNGLAFGGGTELALACDVVLAAESARFAFKEPTVGLAPGYGVVRGPEVLGRHWTRYLALSGREIDAARAERAGLVQ